MTEQGWDQPAGKWPLKHAFNACVVFLFCALIPIISHAGGLGMAPLAAIIGAVGWLTSTQFSRLKFNPAIFALFVFLIWAAITSMWSPYNDTNTLSNPVKLLIGTALFLGCFSALRAVAIRWPQTFAHYFIAINILTCGLIIFDQLSGYGLTFFFDPIGEDEQFWRKRSDALMNVGHSVTVALLFFAPVIILLVRMFKRGYILVILYSFAMFYASYVSNLAVGMLCSTLCLIIGFAALKWPIKTFQTMILTAIATIAMAPLLGWACGQLPSEFIENLPLSWKHRALMWDYTAGRIWEAPLIGHGFDSVRTFDETLALGTRESVRFISLHPHNAGLHIWVETGLVGVILSCLAILLFGRQALSIANSQGYFLAAMSAYIMAVSIISAISYGVWQDWWWASVIITSALIWAFFGNNDKGHAK